MKHIRKRRVGKGLFKPTSTEKTPTKGSGAQPPSGPPTPASNSEERRVIRTQLAECVARLSTKSFREFDPAKPKLPTEDELGVLSKIFDGYIKACSQRRRDPDHRVKLDETIRRRQTLDTPSIGLHKFTETIVACLTRLPQPPLVATYNLMREIDSKLDLDELR